VAALVAIAIAYFGSCIPGFGMGGAPPSTSAPATPAKDQGKDQGKAIDGIALTVEGERCRRGDAALGPCDALCTSLAAEPKTQKVTIAGTLGTHAAVDALRKCLAEQGFRDVVVRLE
jgi:hypothetical protein